MYKSCFCWAHVLLWETSKHQSLWRQKCVSLIAFFCLHPNASMISVQKMTLCKRAQQISLNLLPQSACIEHLIYYDSSLLHSQLLTSETSKIHIETEEELINTGQRWDFSKSSNSNNSIVILFTKHLLQLHLRKHGDRCRQRKRAAGHTLKYLNKRKKNLVTACTDFISLKVKFTLAHSALTTAVYFLVCIWTPFCTVTKPHTGEFDQIININIHMN